MRVRQGCFGASSCFARTMDLCAVSQSVGVHRSMGRSRMTTPRCQARSQGPHRTAPDALHEQALAVSAGVRVCQWFLPSSECAASMQILSQCGHEPSAWYRTCMHGGVSHLSARCGLPRSKTSKAIFSPHASTSGGWVADCSYHPPMCGIDIPHKCSPIAPG